MGNFAWILAKLDENCEILTNGEVLSCAHFYASPFSLIYVCMKCVLKKLNITLNGIAQIQKCCEADEIGFESFKKRCTAAVVAWLKRKRERSSSNVWRIKKK